VHGEVRAADERIGDVIAVVHEMCAHWHCIRARRFDMEKPHAGEKESICDSA
jgi:hypothetical protein